MNAPAQDLCPGCGTQIPEACVRCRDCGAFLHENAEELASKQAANTSRPEWLVHCDGQQFGPFTTEDLRKAFQAESTIVPREAIVWKHGMGNWVPAHSVREFWS